MNKSLPLVVHGMIGFFKIPRLQNNDVVICITPQSSIDFDSVDTREFAEG